MARIALGDVDKYGSSGNSFFQLKDDGDVAQVRFMYEEIEDVDAYVVHRVKIGNQQRYVSCLREDPDAPLDDCPLCASGAKPMVRLFIPLYDETEKVVKFWERGKQIIKRLQSLFQRFTPLCSHVFEIERNGKQGDNQTTYQFYPADGESKSMEDLPEVPEIMGNYILVKNKDELEEYLDTGKMPGVEESSNKSNRDVEQDAGVRRRGRANSTRRRESF